jgi:hypothetical protein
MRFMSKGVGVWLGLTFVGASCLLSAHAHALLLDNSMAAGDTPGSSELDSGDFEFTYHFPYRTTLSFVDPGYAFDDDPLEALPNRPYRMPVIVKRLAIRRALVAPRTSFVQEMYDSADVL